MRSYKTIIGIDPGSSTGYFGIHNDEGTTLIPMPESFLAIINELKKHEDPIVFVERVGHWGHEDPKKKMNLAKLADNFRDIQNALQACDIDYCLVASITWRKALRLPQVSGYNARKRSNAEIARQKTSIKITQKNADAFLITLFGKIKLESDQEWINENLQNNGTI